MKRINTHLCSDAYPSLESAGVLERSRLRGEPQPLRETRARRRQEAESAPEAGIAEARQPKPQS